MAPRQLSETTYYAREWYNTALHGEGGHRHVYVTMSVERCCNDADGGTLGGKIQVADPPSSSSAPMTSRPMTSRRMTAMTGVSAPPRRRAVSSQSSFMPLRIQSPTVFTQPLPTGPSNQYTTYVYLQTGHLNGEGLWLDWSRSSGGI